MIKGKDFYDQVVVPAKAEAYDKAQSELTKLRKRVEVLEFALKEISTAAPRDDERGTAHASNYYRLKASFNRANQALAESAKIAAADE